MQQLRERDGLLRRQLTLGQQTQQFSAQIFLRHFRLRRIENVTAACGDADDERDHGQHRDQANARAQTAAALFDGAAVNVAALQLGVQHFFEQQNLRCIRAAIPAAEIFRLEGAEAERDVDLVEHDRHEAAIVTSAASFIAHEGRRGRALRPHHDDGFGVLQFTLDDGGVVLPCRERAIPPDIEAARHQRFGDRTHAGAVFAGV